MDLFMSVQAVQAWALAVAIVVLPFAAAVAYFIISSIFED